MARNNGFSFNFFDTNKEKEGFQFNIGQALDNVRGAASQGASNVRGNIQALSNQSTRQDWMRPVRQSAQNIASTPVSVPKPLGQVMNLTNRIVQTPRKYLEGVAESSAYGLIDVPERPSTSGLQRAAYGAGYATGMFNPLNPVNKLGVFSKLDKAGSALTKGAISRLAPKATGRLATKILPAIGAETAQSLGYTGAATTAGLAGLRGNYDITPQAIGADIGLGLATRGLSRFLPQSTPKTVGKGIEVTKRGYDNVLREEPNINDVINRYNTQFGPNRTKTPDKADVEMIEKATETWHRIYGRNKKAPQDIGQVVGDLWQALEGVKAEELMRREGYVLGLTGGNKTRTQPTKGVGAGGNLAKPSKTRIESFFKQDGTGYLYDSASVKANKKINPDGTIELVHLTTPKGKAEISEKGFNPGSYFGLHNNRAIARQGKTPTETMKIVVDPTDIAFGRYAVNRSRLIKGNDGVWRTEKLSPTKGVEPLRVYRGQVANNFNKSGLPNGAITDFTYKGKTTSPRGISTSTEEKIAKGFGKNVFAFDIDRSAKILDANKIPEELLKGATNTRHGVDYGDAIKYAQERGYDAIDFSKLPQSKQARFFGKAENEIRILNPDILIDPATKGVEADYSFNMGGNKQQNVRVVDTPKGKRIKIDGNTSKDVDGVKFEETEQEAAEAIAKEFFDSPEPRGIKRVGYEFNKIFSPLKNVPEETRNTLVSWRNNLLENKKAANAIYTRLKAQEPEIGGDNYAWLKVVEDPKQQQKLSPEARQYLSQVRTELDTMRKQALDQGIEIGYLDNYLNHVWKESTDEIQTIAKGLGMTPSATRSRVIPSYEEGLKLGLTPRFNSPAQLVAHYRYQINKAIANKQLVDDLINSGRLLPESKARELGVYDWKSIDSPFFPRARRRISENEILQERYVAPESIATPLRNIFEDKKGNFFLRGGAWFSKKLQDVTLSGGVPFTPINAFSLANVLKDVTAGRVRSPMHAATISFSDKATKNYLSKNQDVIQAMARDGIDIRSGIDYDTVNKKLGQIFKESKLEGLDTVWDRAMNKPTFERLLPILQLNFYKDALQQAQKSGLSGRAAEQEAAQATKRFYGLIEEFSRSQNTNDFLSTTFFAPTWRESMINFWKENVKSLDPRKIKDKSFRNNQKYILGSLVTLAIYDALNRQLNDGRSMFENKDGKELYLEIPRENGRSWFISFQPSVSTVPRRFAEIGGNLLAGDTGGATERASTFLSQPLNIGGDLLANRTFYDQPIYSQEDNPGQRLSKLAGYGLEQASHPFIGEPLSVAQGRKNPVEAAMGALELPVYPSKSTAFARLNSKQMEKYEKLRALDPAKAEQYRLEASTPESEFEVSDDAPTTKLGKAGLYTASTIANPIQTAQAVLGGEPIRKLRVPEGGPLSFFDSTTVTERKKGVSDLDGGDTLTEVDHAIPKWLGGRETEDNYQILTNQDHARKTAFEEDLRFKYETGEISRNEALKASKEFNSTLNPLEKPTGGVEDKIQDTIEFKKENDIPLTSSELIAQYTKDVPEEPTENTSRYMQAKYEEEKFAAINKALNDDELAPEQQLEIAQSLGVNGDDLTYYQIARDSTKLKSMYVLDEVEQISARTNDRTELLNWLASQRKEINEKKVLTDDVIDELYRRDIISSDEKKALKDLEFGADGQPIVKASGRGKGARIKKISVARARPQSIKQVDQRIRIRPTDLRGVGSGLTSTEGIQMRVRAPQLARVRLQDF